MRSTIIVMIFLMVLLGCNAEEGANQANETLGEIANIGYHNSRNAVDWAGVYAGFIPGADSPGIYVQIILNLDETYEVHYHYSGRGEDVFIFTGNFTWDDEGGTITLDTDRIPPQYRVGENILFQLDMEGNRITGAYADMYVLRKVEGVGYED